MYCKNCGGKIEPEQKFCPNCSAAVTASTEENPETVADSAKKYKPQIVKISILNLCAQALSLLLVVALLFLPIYTSTPTELDAIQDWDDMEELIENDGKLSFSLFDEIKLIFDALFPDEGEQSDNEDEFKSFIVLEMGLFPLIEVIMIVMLLISLAITAYEQISNLRDADDYTVLRYDELKKSGNAQIKPSFWKKQTAFSLVIYAIFDIIFTKLFDSLFVDLTNVDFYRYMMDFSGVSAYVSVVIILTVGLFIVNGIAKNSEKEMRLCIAKE